MSFLNPPDPRGPGDGFPENNRVDLPSGSLVNVDIRIVQFVTPDGVMKTYQNVRAESVPFSQIAGLCFQVGTELAVRNFLDRGQQGEEYGG